MVATSIQTTYGYDRPLAISGGLADNGPHYAPPGIFAAEAIQPGKAVVWSNTTQTGVRMPLRNKVTITFSAALSASNVFTMTLTTTDLDGTVVSVPLSETYATSAAATYAAIIADATAADADATGSATGDVITLNLAGNKYFTITVAGAVAGGSAVTVTSAYGSNDSLAGIAGHEKGLVPGTDSLVRYAEGDAVTVWRQGRVWVVTDETIAAGATAYFRLSGDTGANQERGTLLAAAGSPVIGFSSTAVRVAQGASADGLVKLELNLP